MADVVDVKVLGDGQRRITVYCTLTYVDTGEAAGVAKISLSATSHISTLAGGSVETPGSGWTLNNLVLEEAQWSVSGFDGIRIFANRTVDEELLKCPAGEGFRDFTAFGGNPDQGTGGTGNILIQTYGTPAADDFYSVVLKFRKNWVKG